MRDPNRIPKILDAVKKVWEKTPDQRLGQLLFNMTHRSDLYNMEDEELLGAIETWASRLGLDSLPLEEALDLANWIPADVCEEMARRANIDSPVILDMGPHGKFAVVRHARAVEIWLSLAE